MSSLRKIVVGGLLLWSGCSVTRAPEPSAVQDEDRKVTPPIFAEPEVAPNLARMPLAARLASESQGRPATALHADALIAALRAQGVQLTAPKQVLASPVAARYCEATRTGGGLAISVCAYADADALSRGAARSHALFDRIVPGRTLIAREHTLLTITQPGSDAAAGERALALAAFAELKPSARVP